MSEARARALSLSPAAEAQHEVERRLLLDVVVGESAAVLQLLAREDEALLVGGDALLVLDLGLDDVDGVGAQLQDFHNMIQEFRAAWRAEVQEFRA